METKPEGHRHDHVHEEDATMAHGGALSLHHHRGATLFGHHQRHDDEEAAGRRSEIREVDFFSRDSGARDGGGGRRLLAGGGGRDDVNVSRRLDLDRQLLPYMACRFICAHRVKLIVLAVQIELDLLTTATAAAAIAGEEGTAAKINHHKVGSLIFISIDRSLKMLIFFSPLAAA